GFTGNVALKTMEGFSSFLLGSLREVFGGNWRTRLAYLLVRKNLGAMRERLVESQGDPQCDSSGGQRTAGSSCERRNSGNPCQNSTGWTGQTRGRQGHPRVVRQNARAAASPRQGGRRGQARRRASGVERYGLAARTLGGARRGPSCRS